ncbi:DNA mismatch repair endonuclease MutL [Fulvivirgaceae bacterium LMO-SS25]
MPDSIRLLPDAIANQIAAGEVVQRPASVVKELMENAVDAGASEIKVIIKEAGKSLIQVMDNGSGMSETDARLCFERHATSKIKEAADLFTIRTMGFRGEAMASIAAVAQVELKTRQEDDETGILIEIEGSELKTNEAVACPKGTSIAVKNLFYNVPARRNFLKSNPVETKHIIDEFQRVALAYPEIGFALLQNDLETYRLSPGKLSHRITGLFGNNYREQLVPCSEETSLLRVTGYVGTPAFAKKSRGEQFFFANNRFIKNSYLNHSVVNAFHGLIAADQFPFYVLNLEIDPVHIDINVHPTKTEIKFDDERSVYAVIQSAIRQALGKFNISPSIDFDSDVNFGRLMTDARPVQANPSHEVSSGFGKQEGSFHKAPSTGNQDWKKLFEGTQIGNTFSADRYSDQPTKEVTFESAANELALVDENITGNEILMQLHRKYILSQVKSGLMMINQEAAMERILYEKYISALDNKNGSSQQILFPEHIELNPADFGLVENMREEIQALGFEFEVFGKNSLQIHGAPSDVSGIGAKEIFEGLIEQFKSFKANLSLDKSENLARSLAKRSTWKEGKALSQEEMRGLIDKLFACKNPNFSPEGARTFVLLDVQRLQSLFN